ncbi:MAG: hypothetical protein AAF432_08820 [Planctomycetota bacterium]
MNIRVFTIGTASLLAPLLLMPAMSPQDAVVADDVVATITVDPTNGCDVKVISKDDVRGEYDIPAITVEYEGEDERDDAFDTLAIDFLGTMDDDDGTPMPVAMAFDGYGSPSQEGRATLLHEHSARDFAQFKIWNFPDDSASRFHELNIAFYGNGWTTRPSLSRIEARRLSTLQTPPSVTVNHRAKDLLLTVAYRYSVFEVVVTPE